MEEQHPLLIMALPRLPATTREKSFQLPSLMHAHTHTRSHVPQLPETLAHSQPDLQHGERRDGFRRDFPSSAGDSERRYRETGRGWKNDAVQMQLECVKER